MSVRVGSGGFSVPNENVTTDRDVTDQPQSTRPRHENGQSRGTVRFVNAAPKDRIVENALAKAADDLGVPNVDLSRVAAVPHPAGVTCRGAAALGCFRVLRVTLPSGEVREYGRLEFSMTKPGSIGGPSLRKVLAHEAIHAVRWASGDPNWARHDEATDRTGR